MGLSILPVGEGSRQLAPSLIAGELRKLMDGLRGQFDLCPGRLLPGASVADAFGDRQYVDGVLLSVRPRMESIAASPCRRLNA